MRILVTGAKGLLGRQLVAMLNERAHDVLAWDVDELDISDFESTRRAILELLELELGAMESSVATSRRFTSVRCEWQPRASPGAAS